jgi:uncharacterized Rossmann fold enzyme
MKRLNINEKYNVTYAAENWVKEKNIIYSSSKIKDRLVPSEERIEEPIAIVGFGPSLKKTWRQIRKFKRIITCSGAHKFLIERGIIPTYHTDVDPREHKITLLGNPHKDVQYLVASTCHPKYIDLLEGYNTKLWHTADNSDAVLSILQPDEFFITGGSDAGVRAITLAALMGYRNMHIFGIDGCYEGNTNKRHAAKHPNSKIAPYELEYEGKIYYTNIAMLESAKSVIKEIKILPAINAKFYGEGLVQEMAKVYKPDLSEISSEYENVVAMQKPRLITKEYSDLNWQLHRDNPVYGVGGGKYASLVMKLCEGLNTRLVLDYGCGKGLLGKSLPFPIWEYDPAIPGKEDGNRPADIVICTDVLEHIEPELLDEVLSDIKRCLRYTGYLVIHTGQASKTYADGRNTHLIQQGKDWWLEKLKNYFLIGSVNEIGKELHIVIGNFSLLFNKVYIGWDSRETEAYEVAKNSITNNKKSDLIVVNPLKLDDLKEIFNRPIEWRGNQMWCPISNAPQTTEFSTSRFVIPFITKGWALFVDCDIVCKTDIQELFKLADNRYAVMVVKHQQKVGENEVKMVDQASVYYERKNWSSVMLINCDHPAHRRLTKENLNNWPGRDLHAFKWLNDDEIGELPIEWNYLVGVSDPDKMKDAKILHYTLGGPWISGWQSKDTDNEWINERDKLIGK